MSACSVSAEKAGEDVTSKAGEDVTSKAGEDVTSKAGEDVTSKAGGDVNAKPSEGRRIWAATINVVIKPGVKFIFTTLFQVS
ncbi:MAG: hypothetical protein JEZ12_26850 [Desulfobacterium sp.]|nr:hypothetical protein [Desulfobacterium sp.]